MPNIDVLPESTYSGIRRVRINPKTLKTHTGVSHARFLRISSESCQSILLVELDQKAPLNKCFVPEYTFVYIGKSASVSTITELPCITSLVLVSQFDPNGQCLSPHGSETLRLYSELLLGNALCDNEQICLNYMGRLIFYTVSCTPTCGVVSSQCCLRIESGLSTLKEVQFPTVRGFERVGGLDSVVRELLSIVKVPLNNPDSYRKYGISPPRGILLFGPPGTGKTLLASALSEELATTLVESVRATDLTGFDSDTKIHAFFAATRRKCIEMGFSSIIVFIDEIDLLCPSRDSGVNESEKRAVGALLTEMDGFDSKSRVNSTNGTTPLMVLAATNRPNSIDIALRRPGRFEKEIEIAAPDAEGRLQILTILSISRFRLVWTPTMADLKYIASVTHGFVGADLLSLISQSSFKAIELDADLSQDVILEQLKYVRPSALRELAVSVPKTRWDDIGGYDDVKGQLIESVIWPVIHHDAFRRLGVQAPRGILLYGPPGCSKTMMARAVATESSMNFISVKGPEIFSKWVGESEQAIRDIFRKARQSSPCVIFFDEIDAIASCRDGGDGGVSGRVLTQMLTEMDGIFSSKQVIVIAATNRPHVIDSALMRPGRLDRIVYVGLPDATARKCIWMRSLYGIPHSFTHTGECFDELSAKTEGYSGAEVVALIKEAAILSIRQNFMTRVPKVVDVEETEEHEQHDTESPIVLSWKHIQDAIFKSKPRTDSKLLDILENFSQGFTH